MPPRSLVLEELGDALAAVHAPGRVTRIGIDGVDGAGKTRPGEELAQELTSRERPAVRVSLDQFERERRSAMRAATSHPEGFDALDETHERFRVRYKPAQRRYIEEQRPDERATFVFGNTDLREPELVRQPRPR